MYGVALHGLVGFFASFSKGFVIDKVALLIIAKDEPAACLINVPLKVGVDESSRLLTGLVIRGYRVEEFTASRS